MLNQISVLVFKNAECVTASLGVKTHLLLIVFEEDERNGPTKVQFTETNWPPNAMHLSTQVGTLCRPKQFTKGRMPRFFKMNFNWS